MVGYPNRKIIILKKKLIEFIPKLKKQYFKSNRNK